MRISTSAKFLVKVLMNTAGRFFATLPSSLPGNGSQQQQTQITDSTEMFFTIMEELKEQRKMIQELFEKNEETSLATAR